MLTKNCLPFIQNNSPYIKIRRRKDKSWIKIKKKINQNMETTSSSSSTPSSSPSHIFLSSALSLLKSCQKHIVSKIENLVEYSYIPKFAQINESQFPIMSPYNLYKQKTSLTRSIRTLISTKLPLPKEYIQSSRLD